MWCSPKSHQEAGIEVHKTYETASNTVVAMAKCKQNMVADREENPFTTRMFLLIYPIFCTTLGIAAEFAQYKISKSESKLVHGAISRLCLGKLELSLEFQIQSFVLFAK